MASPTPEVDLPLDNSIGRSPIAVYEDLWTKFYRWEYVHCQDSLARLGTQDLHGDKPQADVNYHLEYDDDLEDGIFTYEDMDNDQTFRMSPVPPAVSGATDHEPHRPYTICTPLSENMVIKPGDPNFDHPVSSTTSFIPMADDPKFKLKSYLKCWQNFGWQIGFEDPDCKYSLLRRSNVR